MGNEGGGGNGGGGGTYKWHSGKWEARKESLVIF